MKVARKMTKKFGFFRKECYLCIVKRNINLKTIYIMVSMIFNRTTKNGRKVMIMFGYESGGECYTRFADASYENFDRGASYAAFVASAEPDTLHCFECDTKAEFMDRALTVAEKEAFQKKVLAGYEA